MVFYSYKFRLYPTESQKLKLEQHFGGCRFVYNYFLESRIALYKETGKQSNFCSDGPKLPALKSIHPWLKEVNAQSLQQELRNLDSAYKNFFDKRTGFPQFHCKKTDKQFQRINPCFGRL